MSENDDFSGPCATLARVTSLAAVSELEPADQPPETIADASERALAVLQAAAERVEDYAGRSKSAATIKAYAAGWRDFLAFCAERELSALPASEQTVAVERRNSVSGSR